MQIKNGFKLRGNRDKTINHRKGNVENYHKIRIRQDMTGWAR